MSAEKNEIICVGEVLWDALPQGLFLGGAPLNVGIHLHEQGERTVIVSRVGDDRLGREAIRRIQKRGVETDLVQFDAQNETGFVEVTLDKAGNPTYEIVEPVAWDFLEETEQLTERVRQSWGIVFGSLAQREEETRQTLFKLFDHAKHKVFDINLRPPFIDRDAIEHSIRAADILKLNHEELEHLRSWFGLKGDMEQSVRTLAQQFDCATVAVTRGAHGAVLLHNDKWVEHSGFEVTVKDAVGAGDAFLAALITGIKQEQSGEEILTLANATGAFVASQNGATPAYDLDEVKSYFGLFERTG